MPGMGRPLNPHDPTVVSAFHTALYHQGLVALLILAALIIGWNVLRIARARRTAQTGLGGGPEPGKPAPAPEPDARRLLRIGFGLLWILDGLLQTQASMPLGLVPQVIQPAAANSPDWVQHVVNSMATTWTYHPIVAAAAVVWIQVGIGFWLLAAPRGNGSRLAALASAGWGLVIWVFGESFGGIFAPGLSWLTGAPGAALIYCVAGLLIALPEGSWRSPLLGRTILRTVGLFFVGMALLQAWPGRGFWQGGTAGSPGSLASSVQSMSEMSQPRWVSSWIASFEGFDFAHGWAINLFVVIALALIGVAFLTARRRVLLVAVVAAGVLCLEAWVFIEDLGFLGGVGTDPNSMIPMILVFVAGYLALSRLPATTDDRSTAPATAPSAGVDLGFVPPRPRLWWGVGAIAARVGSVPRAFGRWKERLVADPTYAFRSLAALGAIGVTLIGAAPMAAARGNSNADPILARVIDGPAEVTNIPTPDFSLVDQFGRRVSLASLHGKTVALTFLDPTCTAQTKNCAAAQELRLADAILGARANRVELVAIDTNPQYQHPDYLVAFDSRVGLDKLGNWLYLTGPQSKLWAVLTRFSDYVAAPDGGVHHGQLAYVLDGSGHTREVLTIAYRLPPTKVMESSVAVALANAVEKVASYKVSGGD